MIEFSAASVDVRRVEPMRWSHNFRWPKTMSCKCSQLLDCRLRHVPPLKNSWLIYFINHLDLNSIGLSLLLLLMMDSFSACSSSSSFVYVPGVWILIVINVFFITGGPSSTIIRLVSLPFLFLCSHSICIFVSHPFFIWILPFPIFRFFFFFF